MKKYWTIFRIELQNTMAYKGAGVVWMLFDLLWLFAFPFIWYVVLNAREGGINGWDATAIVHYYVFMAFLNNLIFMHPEVHTSNEIYEGRLTNYIVRPVSYMMFTFLHEVAWKVVRIVLFFPVFVGIVIAIRNFIPFELPSLNWQVIPASLLAAPIFFLTAFIIALTSFWLEDSKVTKNLFWISSGLLGGQFAPLDLMPDFLQKVAAYLPFKYAMYFPLSVLSRAISTPEMIRGFLGQIIWVAVLLLFAVFVWRRGLRVYNAIGR